MLGVLSIPSSWPHADAIITLLTDKETEACLATSEGTRPFLTSQPPTPQPAPACEAEERGAGQISHMCPPWKKGECLLITAEAIFMIVSRKDFIKQAGEKSQRYMLREQTQRDLESESIHTPSYPQKGKRGPARQMTGQVHGKSVQTEDVRVALVVLCGLEVHPRTSCSRKPSQRQRKFLDANCLSLR